jgi:hypothetical protein
MIDLAEEVYGVDIKKNSNRSPPLVLATKRKVRLQTQEDIGLCSQQQTYYKADHPAGIKGGS